MPSWWGKSSSKEVKRKENRESIIDIRKQKLKSTSEEKSNDKSRESRRHRSDTISEKGSRSLVPSRSHPPLYTCSTVKVLHNALPLPLPGLHLPSTNHANSRISVTSKLESTRGSMPSLYFPLPKPGYVSKRGERTYAEGDIGSASVSSNTDLDGHFRLLF